MANPATASGSLPIRNSPGSPDTFGVTDYTGPYKQLWHLLLGLTDVASNDVVHEELVNRCNTIVSGLAYYDIPDRVQIPPVTSKTSKKDKLKIELMKSVGIPDSVAMELLSLFFLYEYNGEVKSLEELLVNDSSIKKFVEDITKFYMNERLCVLYCSQVILNGAADNNHRFSAIFSAFVASASLPDWCKWLCLSLKKSKNDDERIQVLHTLCILLHNFGEFDGVMMQFSEEFTFGPTALSVTYAEAIVFYAFMHHSCTSLDLSVETFMANHSKTLDDNPFMYASLLASYAERCRGNETIRSVTRQNLQPERCARDMIVLLDEYKETSFRNKHGLTEIIYKCILTTAETILGRFEKKIFGADDDWNLLLLTLLRHADTARLFMLDQPEELTLLYTEALMRVPVEIDFSLGFWMSTCNTATFEAPAMGILERITEINALAKTFEDDEMRILRPNGNTEWVLLRDLNIGGVHFPAGTIAQQIKDHPLFLIFELDCPVRTTTIWDVLMNVVIKNAFEECPNFEKRTIGQVCSIAKFMSEFSRISSEAPEPLINLFHPIITILKRILEDVRDPQLESKYLALLVDVVRAEAVYNLETILNNTEPPLWPTSDGSSYIAETILTNESILNSDYSVTKIFLRNVIELFEVREEVLRGTGRPSEIVNIDNPEQLYVNRLRLLYRHAITFIVENIYPSFVRWRMNRPSDQFEIIRDTFRILCTLFQLENPAFVGLKHQCCKYMLVPGSSLLAVLGIDSEQLEDSWIRTSKDNQFLDQTIYYALTLLVCLSDFDVNTLQMLDNSSNLTLVKKLGQLVRHRLNPTLPTLAIDLLRTMALHLNISVLACFGLSVDAFRDLLQQRLVYRTESSKLKVAIMEFLTVCAQTQPGLIQHFFQDETSASSLLELLSETGSNVPVSALALVRALNRKSSVVFKAQGTQIWTEIIKPIKGLNGFTNILSKQKIISYTMNILSFEIYRLGAIENDFSAVLIELLEANMLLKLVRIASIAKDLLETKKATHAIKHLLTLVLARPDHDLYLPDSVRHLCLNGVLESFWRCVEMEENEELLPGFAELMCVLGPSSDPGFLEKLCVGLPQSFKTATLPVQVPLLTLIQTSITVITSPISLVTIESLVRILSDVFYHTAKIYESISIYLVRPLLSVASSIMCGIIASPYCRGWANVFKQRMIVSAIMTVAHVGIQRGEAPEIVQDALGSLIRLSRYPGTADMLRNVAFTTELYLPLTSYSAPESSDDKWFEVYMLCCDLNSAMMESGHFYFLEESLNFWTIHGEFVIVKLCALTQLINHSYLQTPDQNFHTIKQLLTFVVVAFHGIAVMTPYFQRWRLQQHQTLVKLMAGVFTMLETSVSLLSQPNHLLLVITKGTKGATMASPAFKLTPQLLEVQTKLWEVISMGVHLYLKIGPYETELISKDKILPLLFSIIGLCGRVLSKHPDKKAHPVVNVTSEVNMTMEKGLTLVFRHVLAMIGRQDRSTKQGQEWVRETSSEITSLCDMVRRLGLPAEDFSIKMSAALEENVKQMLCK